MATVLALTCGNGGGCASAPRRIFLIDCRLVVANCSALTWFYPKVRARRQERAAVHGAEQIAQVPLAYIALGLTPPGLDGHLGLGEPVRNALQNSNPSTSRFRKFLKRAVERSSRLREARRVSEFLVLTES